MADRVADVIRPPIRLTIFDVISSLGLGPGIQNGKAVYEYFRWPPDVFAMAATILHESGAYLQATRSHNFSADSPYILSTWRQNTLRAARAWRAKNCLRDDPPEAVTALLDDLAANAMKPLYRLSVPDRANFSWLPLLQLLAMADQTCRGMGILFPVEDPPFIDLGENDDPYPRGATLLLQSMQRLKDQIRTLHEDGEEFRPVTLCRLVDPSRAIVLPKMRTSQRGVTIRSFSFHLALLNGTDVEPVWNPAHGTLLPNANRRTYDQSTDPKKIATEAGPYNILLLPWPFEINPAQFEPAQSELPSLGGRPHEKNGLFGFKHTPDDKSKGISLENIKELIAAARIRVGHVHGLVLPEMAMTRKRFNKLFYTKGEATIPAGLEFVACGVYEPPDESNPLGKNYVIVLRRDEVGTADDDASATVIEQEKHHRWALDPSQLAMYSLGSSLRSDITWWEAIEVRRRRLSFFCLDALVAFTVLVCEDLARPDPVADAVRSVGPNLVICILMDGPQLATRWAARYATVLADDPGSSVITLSSLGMVKLSRVRERPDEQSNVVALWREPGGPPVELRLPDKMHGLLLSLTPDNRHEYTLDGRDDNGMASVLRLAGVHPVKADGWS